MNEIERSALVVDEVGTFKEYAKNFSAAFPPKPVEIWLAARVPLRAEIAKLREQRDSAAKICGELKFKVANLESCEVVMRAALERCVSALAYAAYNYDGSKLENLPADVLDSTGVSETALIAERQARIALAKSQPQPLNECSTLCHPDEACMISADGECPDKPLGR